MARPQRPRRLPWPSRCARPTGGARRAAGPIERAVRQALEQRRRKIRAFPNQSALERFATAILVEIDEPWIATD